MTCFPQMGRGEVIIPPGTRSNTRTPRVNSHSIRHREEAFCRLPKDPTPKRVREEFETLTRSEGCKPAIEQIDREKNKKNQRLTKSRSSVRVRMGKEVIPPPPCGERSCESRA